MRPRPRDLPRTAALAVVGVVAGCHHRTKDPIMTPPPPPAQLTAALELTAEDGAWSIGFVLANPTAVEVTVELDEPLIDFGLEVTTAAGAPLTLVQPGLDVPAYRRDLVLAPGATARLPSPIRLRFDPAVPPNGGPDPFLWTVRSAPVPIHLRATLTLAGQARAPVDADLDPT